MLYIIQIFRGIDAELQPVKKLILDVSSAKETSGYDLAGENNEKILKLKDYMDRETPYPEPSLTIQDLSKQIKMPVRDLSILTTNHTCSLSEFTKVQADYFYSSPIKRGLYEYGYRSGLNIAVKQTMFKKNMQLSLLLNDVFNTAHLKDYTSVVNGIKQVYAENNGSRFFRLSLIYNFGNNRIDVKQREFGNDDERKRSK